MKKATTCLALLGMATSLPAATVTTNLFYDDTAGPNNGGNVTASSYAYNDSLTDAATGIEFDIVVTIAAPTGFNLRTNGGTGNREWGVRDVAGTNNSAIDAAGESITASLTSITVTNFNGNDPGDVSVVFDGFTDVILYFVGNDGDSGILTDGSTTLFSWNGTLDATENGGSPDLTVGTTSMIENPTTGQSTGGSPNASNARIDLSATLPTTLVAEYEAFSGSGTPTDPNRWRVDDFGTQFTVTVVPEPQIALLGGLGLLGLLRRRR